MPGKHEAIEIEIPQNLRLDEVNGLGFSALSGMTRVRPESSGRDQCLRGELEKSIVGQDSAINSIVDALNRQDIRDPNRPIANLLFLGPTGVGKTQTAKELSRLLSTDSTENFLKIDCSVFSQGHTISALLGSPPGYVGHEQKAVLDSDTVEQPQSVVLFDEIEKGSPPLWDLLLQIMDEGEITLLNGGKRLSFKNSIIIATSNVGSTEISNLSHKRPFGFVPENGTQADTTKIRVENITLEALKKQFRPELIGRFDKRVVFRFLSDNNLQEILQRYLTEANKRYSPKGFHLEVSPALYQDLVKKASERDQFGARPVIQAYKDRVETMLGDLLGSGSIKQKSWVRAMLQEELPENSRTGKLSDVVFFQRSIPTILPPRHLKPNPLELVPVKI